MNWQVSQDGQRMIGHMLLRKNIDGEDILGLKIVGGTTLSSSRKGAIIEKVKRGSIAEQEGHLRVGKDIYIFHLVFSFMFRHRHQPDAHSLMSLVTHHTFYLFSYFPSFYFIFRVLYFQHDFSFSSCLI